ncbi:DUF3488 and transglutaminase-like domain-containing protein [Actinocrispum sp. NPDC049592]|uniref:transglutaminase family protein n=1 Tax=Actinocrispum sp. NPDC049592 TaxID=3154835 RepID=UPI003445FE49
MTTSARPAADQWSNTVTPVFAAITTLCAATALSGVIDGSVWLGHVAVAIIVVTGAGIGLRALRVPILLIGLCQLLALAFLVTALFTTEGVFGFIPGPKAIDQLGDVLRGAVTVIQTGVPPVEPTTPILCLVVIAIGLVAVLVDALAVAAGTPAASGLVLLCVYAVPASLADEMLPWWSFVLGAGSYALLLWVDGTHRHQVWRGRSSRTTGLAIGAPTVLVAAAVLLSLLTGETVTAIGTVGQLPGNAGTGATTGGYQIKPFTKLRGMLNQKGNQEMFRVRGLTEDHRYLRAVTLKVYNANDGWSITPTMPPGTPLAGDLPLEPGRTADGPPTRIEVEPVNSEDNWAPVYGSPRRVEGVPGDVRYDEFTGSVYVKRARKLPKYVEWADLARPTYEQLEAATPADGGSVQADYLNLPPLDPRITGLARQLTQGKTKQWDKVNALLKYFSPDNGFVYKTETAQASDSDALSDFLFNGKAGYCEQYASAMAVLVRAAGIPARVAIGYTSGFQMADYRSITTQDAHAWVEVFFPQFGWVTVDPTPLSDGRGETPPYMNPQSSTPGRLPDGGESSAAQPPASSSASAATGPDKEAGLNNGGEIPTEEKSYLAEYVTAGIAGVALVLTLLVLFWRRKRWAGTVALVAAFVWVAAVMAAVGLYSWWIAIPLGIILLAGFPAFIRMWRRRERLHTVNERSMSAAEAAWQELLAESWDRGATIPDTDTVRMTARRLVREHSLDEEGMEGLRTVVGVIERSWYGSTTEADPALPAAVNNVRASMRRNAPLALRAKLMPKSILKPRRRRTSLSEDEEN